MNNTKRSIMLRGGLNLTEADNEAKALRRQFLYNTGSNEEIAEAIKEHVISYINSSSLPVEFSKEEKFELAKVEILVEVAALNEESKLKLAHDILDSLFEKLVLDVVRAGTTQPAVTVFDSTHISVSASAPASPPFVGGIEGVWMVNLDMLSTAAASSAATSVLASVLAAAQDPMAAYVMPVAESSSNTLSNLRMAALKSRDPRRIHTAVFNHLSSHFSDQDILKQKIAEIISEARISREDSKGIEVESTDAREFASEDAVLEMEFGVDQIRETITAIVLSLMMRDEEEYWRGIAYGDRRRGGRRKRKTNVDKTNNKGEPDERLVQSSRK